MAGYPITPATDVLEWMAKYAPKYGGVVVQAEDELAAINMIIGAAFAGVRAMTATSGPGLSLMTEGIGLAGVDRDADRHRRVRARRSVDRHADEDRTEQPQPSDLLRVTARSRSVVLAPGTVEESFYLTSRRVQPGREISGAGVHPLRTGAVPEQSDAAALSTCRR